jgi:hypothetical protein
VILRCTKKLLTVIRPEQLINGPPDGEDWYANLLWLSGRKCLLLTHAVTLFTVFEADVRAAVLRDPGRLVTGLISRELAARAAPGGHVRRPGPGQRDRRQDRRPQRPGVHE